MKIIVEKDYQAMSKAAARVMIEQIKASEESPLISIAGGDTPLGLVEAFVEAINNKEVDITDTAYISLDEWVGLGKADKGSCAEYNYTNLLMKIKQFFNTQYVINGKAEDVQAELKRIDTFIENHGGKFTVNVLGIGLNGHLGFNEAGIDIFEETGAKLIELAETTTTVMTKYFGDNFKPTHGITQSIHQIMNSELLILVANGEKKAEIIQRALEGEITNEVPASVLQNHPNVYVVLDEAAAAKLKNK